MSIPSAAATPSSETIVTKLPVLKWMRRRHSAVGARRAFSFLREAGFDNISVDIIYGVNGMSLEMLKATVQEVLEWHPEHISAYHLSIDDNSDLRELNKVGKYIEIDDDESQVQYKFVCSALAAAGYEHYEISNWALPGRRAVHNSAYWTRAPYVGLGPGAHSLRRNPDVRSWNSEALSGWTSSSEILSPDEIREEQIMLGLRTADGVPGYGRIPEDRWFVADSIIAGLI